MTTPPAPANPPADPPAPANPPADPPAPPANPPADPPAPAPDDDIIRDRAELAALREENTRLKAKKTAPAPPKKTAPAPPAPTPPTPPTSPPAKRRRRVSRLMGDHYDDED